MTAKIVMGVFGPLSLWAGYAAVRWAAVNAWFLLFTLPIFYAALAQYRRLSIDALIFRSRINGQNLLVLWQNVPTVGEFESFTNGLRDRLRKVEVPLTNPVNQSVADELRKLGDLKKDGIISETEFVEAKKKLLGALEKRTIGFN